MPLAPRISLVTLAVSDLPRSRSFYEALGWQPGFSNDEVAFFQLGGLVLGLWRKEAMSETIGVAPSALVSGGMELAHNVPTKDEVAQAVATVRQAGGSILVEPHDAPWGGHTSHVADPDGYRWEIAWNPGWRIDEQGTWIQ